MLSMCVYIYIYMILCMYMYVCIYTYISCLFFEMTLCMFVDVYCTSSAPPLERCGTDIMIY